MRTLGVVVVMLLIASPGVAQETPDLTPEQQVLVELNNEAERLANNLQTALEQVATLQARVNVLTRAYNILRLSLIREQSTPAMEGYIYNWDIDSNTGQRRGLVPVSDELADDKEP